ncbi:MAG: hypothetical protein P8J50_11040 [Acidimicrobiales bacterium]|nr:hypothetical protein [Acidimicrobiales bacterium]
MVRSAGDSLTSASPAGQMASPGFWVVEHGAAAVSDSVPALRLFSFLAGVVLVLAGLVYARRHLQYWAAKLAFVGVLAFSPSLIRYSAELKQYGVEATVVMLLLLAVAERRRLGRTRLTIIALGALVFSIPALVLVPLLGLGWFAEETRRRRSPGAAARYLL